MARRKLKIWSELFHLKKPSQIFQLIFLFTQVITPNRVPGKFLRRKSQFFQATKQIFQVQAQRVALI